MFILSRFRLWKQHCVHV